MGRIGTLNTDDDHHSNDQGSDDDEGRQGFFVGGSEHSGQQVLGPSDADRNRRAQHLMDAVRRAGAEELSPEESAKIRAGGPSASFQGGAYRLGDTDAPIPIPQPTESSRGPAPVRVFVWQNGFSIDDGPLRSFEDPASRAFLMSLQQGSIPAELQAQYRGREIDLHMERRPTDYVPPKTKPFAVQGHRLGSIVPEVVTLDDGPSDKQRLPEKKLSPEEAKSQLEKAQAEIGLDESKPKGQIQIREPGGQSFVGEFNTTSTVEDVRTFIVTALPDYSYQPFRLFTTYPKRAIDDEKQTVVDAGIFKAVVVMVKD